MDLPELEQRLREHVAAIPSPARAEMLRVFTILDDAKRAKEIGELYGRGIVPAAAELLMGERPGRVAPPSTPVET
jgi:hypothetical protein